jgi:gliding motility-associated-like protein
MMSVTDRAMLSVRGNIINRSEGFIYNSDTINLIGDWQNDNSANACDSTYAGIVRFTGDNQELNGIYPTHFYYLSLENTGIKTAQVDQNAYGKLLLNDRELAVNSHTVFVKNSNINSVNNTTGFVSSTDDGGLQRDMNQLGAYLFPLGSSITGTLYRPIVVNTKDNIYQVYKAGLSNNDASSDGYDREIKERFICTINNLYYHRIYKNTSTSPVNIDFWYEPTDGNFNNIAHWDNTSIWQKADTSIQTTSGIFLVTSIKDWDDFNEKPFALAYTTAPFGLAGNDTSIYLGASIQLNTDASAIVTWSPDYNLSCTACPNPIANPDTTMFYYVSSERQDACKNIDTIKITVIPSLDNLEIFIPNTITPNGDGANDKWVIRALEQFPNNEVIVLNRWGDQIFTKKPYDNSFDGTLWGQDIPEGSYYYLVKIKVDSDTKTFDGPLTIIR